jgi:hypothetical protein
VLEKDSYCTIIKDYLILEKSKIIIPQDVDWVAPGLAWSRKSYLLCRAFLLDFLALCEDLETLLSVSKEDVVLA